MVAAHKVVAKLAVLGVVVLTVALVVAAGLLRIGALLYQKISEAGRKLKTRLTRQLSTSR
jgi:hypothetical protein